MAVNAITHVDKIEAFNTQELEAMVSATRAVLKFAPKQHPERNALVAAEAKLSKLLGIAAQYS